jgi:MYXO-CTERM domain-containing protein
VKGTITFPDGKGTANPPVKAQDVPLYKDENKVRLFAATLIGVVSLALLVVGLLAFLRRRRRDEDTAPAR